MKKLLFISGIVLLAGITFFFPVNRMPFSGALQKGFRLEEKKLGPGNEYTFFYAGENRIEFRVQRPNKNDTSLLLCIPAAFTRTGDLAPDGLYLVKGMAGNRDSINHHLGGAMKITGNSVSVFPTNKGKIFTEGFVDSLSNEKASLFQQLQMVKNGEAEDSRSLNKFQCRGIAVLYNGEVCIIESKGAITLKSFADDVAGVESVKDLIYTDMGSWDEGWYREPGTGAIKTIGTDLSQTKKQSNWVVVKMKNAK